MKKFLLILFTLALVNLCFAQIKKPANAGLSKGSSVDSTVPFYKKLKFGMAVPSIGFSSTSGIISIAPIVYYPVHKKLWFGIMPQYFYSYQKYYYPDQNGNTQKVRIDYHIFAPDVFAQFNVYENIFLRADYEYLTFKEYDGNTINPKTGEYVKVWKSYPSAFIGAGLNQGNFFFMLQYNLNYSSTNSFYSIPLRYSAGFYF